MPSERTPLLWSLDAADSDFPTDPHAQFCMMTGVPSSGPTPNGKKSRASSAPVPPKSLYGRATRQLSKQTFTYYMTASLSNTMLLSQVVLGAALTALGASESSHILITIFGAMNTIIAGLVAYLKSRGQPMRARMYRDDLERVVDEIENSEVMWLGITTGVNGYDDIDTGDRKSGERGAAAVTVRSEVARLTRLYERAVRNNTVNNPDMYMTGAVDGNFGGATLRNRGAAVGAGQTPAAPMPVPAPITTPAVGVNPGGPTAASAPAAAPPAQQPPPDPDESPATAPPKPKEDKKPEEKKEADNTKGKEKEDEGAKSDDAGSSDPADSKAEKKEGKAADEEPAQNEQGQEHEQGQQPQQQQQQQPQPDPDAEPASEPNVPLKKVAGDSTDGDN